MTLGPLSICNLQFALCNLRPIVLVSVLVVISGCTTLPEYLRNGLKVGPNYVSPAAPVAHDWIDAGDKRLSKDSDNLSKWWTVFNDPVLDRLVNDAYEQNLTLREAGFRILQARAQLAIAAGGFFPQSQFASGDFIRSAVSEETGNQFLRQRYVSRFDAGFNLAWELDFWGRFRRAIESASANLDASAHDYDDVLVTLLSDVATNYVIMRTTQERIRYAEENVKLQEKTWRIAEARIKVDKDGELNVDQARTLLYQTKAVIPDLEITLRQSQNRLCLLLGIPPEDLRDRLGAAKIPTAPPEVALGIPADLLRRRPDVRRAERVAAAQSARIGIAEADFYPHISINGTFAVSAQHFKDLFKGTAMNGAVGPSFHWDVLNYGRILSNVRLQDARFKELVTAYQNQVLIAQLEVENGLATYLKAQQRSQLQGESAKFAEKAEKVVRARFEIGLENFTRVTQLQQLLVQEQDLHIQAQGQIALGLIQVYKALGGGWQIRCLPNEPAMSAPGPEMLPMPALRAEFGKPN